MIDIFIKFLAGCLGAWCYGYLFKAPPRILFPGAIAGGVSFSCVYILGNYPIWGTALGAFCVGCIAYNLAPRMKVPVTPLITPGIITIVPGISAYNAFMAAISGDYLGGLTGLVNVGAYTVAIAVGLSAAEFFFHSFLRRRL